MRCLAEGRHARLPELLFCLPPASLSSILFHPFIQLCTLYACSASKLAFPHAYYILSVLLAAGSSR